MPKITAAEVIIIGAGPAGFTAAMYLGRFHRKVLVIDGGESRARWIPKSHNIPGFTCGVGGPDLLDQLHSQAMRYGAKFIRGTVSALSRGESGFAANVAGEVLHGPFVVLATGVKDHFPDLAGAEEAVLRALLRFCPICDGYEATDQRIAVIGNGERGERESMFLFQTYSKSVSYLNLGECDPSRRARLEQLGVNVRQIRLDDLKFDRQALWLAMPAAPVERYDVVYSALGCTPQLALANSLNAARDESGVLTVGANQRTSIDGLYAAGDIVRGLNQVVVAAAEAAVAATDIHNCLRQR